MKMIKTAVIVVSLASLTACGGGGSDVTGTTSPSTTTPTTTTTTTPTTPGTTGTTPVATADVLSVTVDSAPAVVYNEMNLGGFYNPAISAAYYPNQTQTVILAVKDGTNTLSIAIPGSTTGTFTVGVNGVIARYTDAATSRYTASSGTVTVTKFDAVNGFVEGIFDVTATKSSSSTTYHVTGSFKATREADQVL